MPALRGRARRTKKPCKAVVREQEQACAQPQKKTRAKLAACNTLASTLDTECLTAAAGAAFAVNAYHKASSDTFDTALQRCAAGTGTPECTRHTAQPCCSCSARRVAALARAARALRRRPLPTPPARHDSTTALVVAGIAVGAGGIAYKAAVHLSGQAEESLKAAREAAAKAAEERKQNPEPSKRRTARSRASRRGSTAPAGATTRAPSSRR